MQSKKGIHARCKDTVMIMSLGHVNILYCRTRAKTNKVSLGDLGCLIFVLSRPDGGLKRALQSHQRHSNNYTEPKLPPRFDPLY